MTKKRTDSRIKKRLIRVKGKQYIYYRVYLGAVNGKPQYKQFKKSKEASDFLKQHDEKHKILSNKVGRSATRLTETKLRDAVTALEMLNNRITLIDAASFYIKHNQSAVSNHTVEQTYNELLANRKENGCKETTINDIKKRLSRFIDEFGSQKIQKITRSDLEKWLNKVSKNPNQRKKYRTQLSGLFTLAFKRDYILNNPVNKIEIPIIRNGKRPAVFTVSETTRLMRTAEDVNPEMIPYFALCLFAGIRPSHDTGEIGRLDWKNILFGSRQIWISQETAKRSIHERYIDMSDNLIQWLLPFKKNKGNIYYKQYWWIKIREKAEVKWANDITRHTFGTYHFGLHKSFDLTCEQMGTSRQMYKKHYKAVLENLVDTNPEKFWKIFPQKLK